MVDTPDTIFRDYVTDGVPSSGAYKPEKAKIRELLNSFTNGTVVTPLNYGATGNGSVDDTAAVVAAMAAAGPTGEVFLPQGKTFLVGVMPDNPYGVVFTGPGKIVTNALSGGQWQRNTYADAPGRQYVYNAEYFYYPLTLIQASQADGAFACPWRIWGDSTVQGGNGEWYMMHEVIGQHLSVIAGLPISQALNHGVSGTDWRDWAETTFLDTQGGVDVIKYFINHNGQSLDDQFAVADAKLASRRAQTDGGIDKRAIILCTGNSTSDSVGDRDEAWHEDVLARLIALGRKHMCVVWDVYSLMQDSRRAGPPDGASTRWMDAPFPGADEERHIHPIRGMNNMLYGRLMNEMLPQSVVAFWSTNTFVNAGIVVSAPVVGATPTAYDIGQRWYTATVANGWPFDGMVQTDKSVDRYAVQRLVGFNNGISMIAERTAKDPATTDDWNPWIYFTEDNGTYTPVVTASTGTITTVGAVSGRYKKKQDVCFFSVQAVITTNGTGSGTLRITLPFTAGTTQAQVGGRNATSGAGLTGDIAPAGTYVGIQTSVNAYPGADATTIRVSGWYWLT